MAQIKILTDNFTAGARVVFDGSESYDNVEPVKYIWSLDGTFIIDTVISYVFEEAGFYEIVLSVEDEAGNVGIDIVYVNITASEEVDDGIPPDEIDEVQDDDRMMWALLVVLGILAVVIFGIIFLLTYFRERPILEE